MDSVPEAHPRGSGPAQDAVPAQCGSDAALYAWGHFSTLEEVVEFYNTLPGSARIGHREESLRPAGLNRGEIDDLVAFLRSLNGELPDEHLLQPPESPIPPSARR